MTSVHGEKGKKMIDEKYQNVTIRDSNSCTVINTGGAMSTARNLYYEQLQEQSDRDYVEVVRCKDCIHYWKNNPSDDIPVCLASPKADAFCSEGERKEDDYKEPDINPCRGCEDYDGKGGCKSQGGCGERRKDETN